MCCKGEPRASVSSDQMSRGNLKLMKLLNELGVTQSQVQFNNPIKYNVYTYIYLIKNIFIFENKCYTLHTCVTICSVHNYSKCVIHNYNTRWQHFMIYKHSYFDPFSSINIIIISYICSLLVEVTLLE